MVADGAADQGGSGFAAVLRRQRLRAGLTQDELAGRAGVGVRTVRDLERGRAFRPQRTTAGLLADALGLAGAEREAFLAAARGHRAEEPLPPTGFLRVLPAVDLIGRDDDLAQLAARLTAAGGPRGITLVGIAGVGKTSLGFAVAYRVAAAYPGGVAGTVITDGSTVGEMLGSIAADLGVGGPDDLPDRVAGRPALVVVDAVERAPEATAEMLTHLLDRLPTVRFLAIGRHPVGLAAEWVWPVHPLATPPPGAADVAAYPAVTLFLERLGRVRGTRPDPDEIASLATLVRRLGGLPLALELAAARSRVLTIPEILDRYGDRVLDLDRPGSEVSLRDAVAASYDLLSTDEQRALRRLAMFRHRWSIDLAEQMIEGSGTDVVRLLDRLLELGLLAVRGSRAFRFRLLDVVRDYAAERAAAEGDLPAARRRHAEVLADLAMRTAADPAEALDAVAGDLGVALNSAADDDPHTALRLASALPVWWRLRGREVSGRRCLRRLLEDPRTADAEPVVRAWARLGLARLGGGHDAAAAALADFERLDVVAGQVAARLWLAESSPVGGLRSARRHAEVALDLARRGGRQHDVAVARQLLARCEIGAGDLPAARRRLAELPGGRGLLAEVARLEGRLDEAVRIGRDALAGIDADQRRRLLATIGRALAEAGRVDEATAVLDELRPADDQPPDGPAAAVEAVIGLRLGEPKRAAECFARAAEAYDAGRDTRDLIEALAGLIASTPDRDERATAVRRLGAVCRSMGAALLPRERALLGADAVAEVEAT